MTSPFTSGYVVAGRYRIESEIGRGGMATVYLARDETHDRDVAVKVLSREVSGELGADRFLREIRTTASLAHPHILTLLDSGNEEGSLFYVTPFVQGESLRDRIRRTGTLPIDECLRIASSLAGALAHAHEQGVIHRDVKPGNVLLDQSGNAYLADFGIARAVSNTGDTLRTASGYVLGTLQYMSPEQISGEREIDGTTDIYALGCVLYEMLAGQPPFKASTRQALLAAHLVRPAPPIHEARPDTPASVDDLLHSALEKEPKERVATASEFARHLDEARTTARMSGGWAHRAFSGRRARASRRRRVALAAGAGAVVAAVALAGRTVWPPIGAGLELDTTRYAVLPFDQDTSAGAVPVDLFFRESLGRWEGITVVDGLQTRDLVSRLAGDTRLSREQTVQAAVELNAGRLLTGLATAVGDSLRVEALLLDPDVPDEPLEAVVVMLPLGGSVDVAEFEGVVESLVFGNTARGATAPTGTTSAPARRAFGLGQNALLDWDLREAEIQFTEAVNQDPEFNLALLWKAQVISWQGEQAERWAADARRAGLAAAEFPEREGLLATGLMLMGDGQHPEACEAYEELRLRDEGDFAAWFGLGECRRRDNLVVADPTSSTGWSFRGSSHTAAAMYQRAFASVPTSYRAFGSGDLDLIHSLFYTKRAVLRLGVGVEGAPATFFGVRQWSGDSLATVAIPGSSPQLFPSDPSAELEALTRQRRTLLETANAWNREFPDDTDVRYTLAFARELLADASALETYREARSLTQDPARQALIGAAQALLQLRLSMPDDLDGLRATADLADSILSMADEVGPIGASRLAELAVLLGRPSQAARLARAAAVGTPREDLPAEVMREWEALMAFASVGGPSDSVSVLEARTEERIRFMVPPGQVVDARKTLLEQAAFLAFPLDTLGLLMESGMTTLPEARAMSATVLGDPGRAATILESQSPGMLWDVRLARAAVFSAMGRRSDALEVLTTAPDALLFNDPVETRGMGRVGPLVRAAALRAELEHELGSPEEAARWARAVEALWATGEPAVNSTIERMREIIRSLDGA